MNTKPPSATDGVLDHDNESVDDIPQEDHTGPSLNPFDNDEEEDVPEDEK